MSTYSISLARPDPRVGPAIAAAYPNDFYRWHDTQFFLKTNDTAQVVGARLGVKTSENPTGINDMVIVRVAPSYWGWAAQDLWTWLQAAFEGGH